jgi:hypothetical protein
MEARAGVADAQRRLWAAYGLSTAPTTQPTTEPTAAVTGANPPDGYVFNAPPPASEQAVPYSGDVDSGYYDNGQGTPEYSGTPGYAPQSSVPANTYDNPYYYPNTSSYNGPYYGSYYGGYPYYSYYPYFWGYPFFSYVIVNHNHNHDHDGDHHWNGNWNHGGTVAASGHVAAESRGAPPAAMRSAPAAHSMGGFSHFGGFGGGHR